MTSPTLQSPGDPTSASWFAVGGDRQLISSTYKRFQMSERTDYEIELAGIDQAISDFTFALTPPMNSEAATKFVYLLYQRAALNGDLKELARAEAVLSEVIAQLGPAGDLYFLKANIDLKFHRLAGVHQALKIGRDLRDSPQGRALEADLDFQEGRYQDAKRRYESLISDDLTWDNLARLAHLEGKLGDTARADQLYLEAEDELTAKEMRYYAWVELQRGVLQLQSGRCEAALAHYERADRAYSGYWLVDDHRAELLGAEGKFADATQLYEGVVERVPRPEFQQALGELYELLGQNERAESWNQRALAAYLAAVESGGVHYYHHLVDFYSDVREDGPSAVKWARKDLELRRNFATLASLAWALYRAGEFAEALDTMNKALASGVKDARLFFQAGLINQAAGSDGDAERYLYLAEEVNPHYRSFHVHR